MRIIAGKFGGRIIKAPSGNRTHPMSEKARGGIFNSLGDITDFTVLDAFAGSGALGFEALSRGASYAQLCDYDKNAYQALSDNMVSLQLDETTCSVSRTYIKSWLNRHRVQFDLVICDPPYNDLQAPTIEKLEAAVKPGGYMILSWPKLADAMTFKHLIQTDRYDYGDAIVYFFKNPNDYT